MEGKGKFFNKRWNARKGKEKKSDGEVGGGREKKKKEDKIKIKQKGRQGTGKEMEERGKEEE